ncbi:MAG: AsnC family transcriptional regulator [Deltaproteobacteria bacterium]|jgi:DNA-binding Lrp family transcriptional regulator|nr:MAG: AsnC family transcriptional regulator [Deltaproteobacteria bacterium]
MLDDLERRIIHHLQGDLPLTARPFAVLAGKVGISEEELIERIRLQKERGILRRFGATLSHQLAGFKANAMVGWYVPEDKIEEIGPLMASFKEVSHCYQRRIQGKWRYNLFTMVHGKSKKDCQGIARRIAGNTGVKDYVLLLTLKEFKKTSPEYF